MLGKVKKSISHTPLNTIPLVVFVLLLTAAINIYVTKLDTDTMLDERDKIVDDHSEQEWNEISLVIELSHIAAKQNSKYLAQKVEVSMMHEYSSLDLLELEFAEKDFTPKFYGILKTSLSQENGIPGSIFPVPQRTFVGLEEGVIALFSNESTNVQSLEELPMVPWEYYISENPNPKLAKAAIDAVVKRESSTIFAQVKPSKDGILEQYNTIDMNTLKAAYLEFGVDGLSHYNLLSPSYITETGDIFSTDDRTFMRDNQTYKLIILQSINLGDVLDKYSSSLHELDRQKSEQIVFLETSVRYKYMHSVTWSFLLFILSVCLINVFNYEKRRDEELQKQIMKDNTPREKE